MVSCIVVTHGNLGGELLKTARKVFGEYDNCHAISNAGKTTDTISQEILSIIDEQGGEDTIIFVDFFGGSCSHACFMALRKRTGALVISGVNLPMLLAFLNKRDEVPFNQLASEIVARSKNSIKLFDSSNL